MTWHGRLAHAFEKHGRGARATIEMSEMPEYLAIPPEKLGENSGVRVRVLGDMQSIARDFADAILREIREKKNGTLIVPVGPVDQFPILAERINKDRIDCRDVCMINMDEYLTDEDEWI